MHKEFYWRGTYISNVEYEPGDLVYSTNTKAYHLRTKNGWKKLLSIEAFLEFVPDKYTEQTPPKITLTRTVKV
jgi:hypothetical protein